MRIVVFFYVLWDALSLGERPASWWRTRLVSSRRGPSAYGWDRNPPSPLTVSCERIAATRPRPVSGPPPSSRPRSVPISKHWGYYRYAGPDRERSSGHAPRRPAHGRTGSFRRGRAPAPPRLSARGGRGKDARRAADGASAEEPALSAPAGPGRGAAERARETGGLFFGSIPTARPSR